MTQVEKILMVVAGGFALCAGAKASLLSASHTAAVADNPYQGIVDRNVFSLRNPPPPPPPPSNDPPPPKLTLTGITTILGGKRALLKGTPPPAKGEPAKEQFYMLSEGQRDGDIEVLAIDEKAGMVRVNDYGTITNLTFDKDGVKLTSSQPANSVPAAIQPPPGSPFGTIRTLPQRTLRLPGVATPSSPQPAAQSGAGLSSYGSAAGVAMSGGPGESSTTLGGLLGQANGQPVGGNGNTIDSAEALAAASQRTPEENVALYEANRLKNQMLIQQGARLPRMPQHPYLGGQQQPGSDPAAQQAQQQAPQ
jgi:hypothetical protein